jgi:hypothetical protein
MASLPVKGLDIDVLAPDGETAIVLFINIFPRVALLGLFRFSNGQKKQMCYKIP